MKPFSTALKITLGILAAIGAAYVLMFVVLLLIMKLT